MTLHQKRCATFVVQTEWDDVPSNCPRENQTVPFSVSPALEGVETLAERIEQLSDAPLEAKIPGREFSASVLLHRLIQHNLYHTGQIAILKEA